MKAARSAKMKAEAGFSQTLSYKFIAEFCHIEKHIEQSALLYPPGMIFCIHSGIKTGG
jgi:hypothetical protein